MAFTQYKLEPRLNSYGFCSMWGGSAGESRFFVHEVAKARATTKACTHTFAHTRTLTHAHTATHTHTHTRTRARTNVYTQARTHALTHTLTLTHTGAQAHTYTHMHTHVCAIHSCHSPALLAKECDLITAVSPGDMRTTHAQCARSLGDRNEESTSPLTTGLVIGPGAATAPHGVGP